LDEIFEPFENWDIEKPKGDVGSMLYNKFASWKK
jgi:hypothetical protein